MSCRKYEKLIVDYLTNELTGPVAERLEEHLKTCKDCKDTLAEYRNVLAKTKELQAPVYGPEFWSAKLNEIKNYQPQRQRKSLLKPVILSASALLVFAVLFARVFHTGENRMVKPQALRNNYAMALNELPYPEETLMDMVDYIDDDSAAQLLNILFENNLLSTHIK